MRRIIIGNGISTSHMLTYVTCTIVRGKLLARSADVIRSTVRPHLSTLHNEIDRHIRLVLTGTGPEYRNSETVQADQTLRRVRNMFYDESFAHLIYQEAMLNHCKVPPPPSSYVRIAFPENPRE